MTPPFSDSETTGYILKRIPRDLWTAAQAKAATHQPPMSMRYVLIQLLGRWVGPAPDGSPWPLPPRKIRQKKATEPPAPVSDSPALNETF